MSERNQQMAKQKSRGNNPEVILPDFPDDDNTVTTTVTKSRRVSFGSNFIKEFIVGSAVSAQCVSEYEQAFQSSDSSNANSSHSVLESGILNQNTFVLEEHLKENSIISPEHEESLMKRPKISSTICFSADSPTADMQFTEGCISLAKSILDKKNKEMTVIIQAKPKDGKEEVKVNICEETKYFEGSQFDMSMTKCFKSKENTREEKKCDSEKTKIFNKYDDEMSITRCDFRMRQSKIIDDEDDDSENSWQADGCKENQMPIEMIMQHLDKDDSDVDKFLFNPEKSLSEVLNANPFNASIESEKLNLNESMDISKEFQSNTFRIPHQVSPCLKIGSPNQILLGGRRTLKEQVLECNNEEFLLKKGDESLVDKEDESFLSALGSEVGLEVRKKVVEEVEMEITFTRDEDNNSADVMPKAIATPEKFIFSEKEMESDKVNESLVKNQEVESGISLETTHQSYSEVLIKDKDSMEGRILNEETHRIEHLIQNGTNNEGRKPITVSETAEKTYSLDTSEMGRKIIEPLLMPQSEEKVNMSLNKFEIKESMTEPLNFSKIKEKVMEDVVEQIAQKDETTEKVLEVQLVHEEKKTDGILDIQVKTSVHKQLLVENSTDFRVVQKETIERTTEILLENEKTDDSMSELLCREVGNIENSEATGENNAEVEREQHSVNEEIGVQNESLMGEDENVEKSIVDSNITDKEEVFKRSLTDSSFAEVENMKEMSEINQSVSEERVNKTNTLENETEQHSLCQETRNECESMDLSLDEDIGKKSAVESRDKEEILQENLTGSSFLQIESIKEILQENKMGDKDESNREEDETQHHFVVKEAVMEISTQQHSTNNEGMDGLFFKNELKEKEEVEEEKDGKISSNIDDVDNSLPKITSENLTVTEQSLIPTTESINDEKGEAEKYAALEDEPMEIDLAVDKELSLLTKSEITMDEFIDPEESIEEMNNGKEEKDEVMSEPNIENQATDEFALTKRSPSLMDSKIIEDLKEQSKEPGCLWTLKDSLCPVNQKSTILSCDFTLVESSVCIQFTLVSSNEDTICSCSDVSTVEIYRNEDIQLRLPEYKLVIDFGFEKLKKYFEEKNKSVKSIRHVPYFLDLMNLFTVKINSSLQQVYSILTLYPCSKLIDSKLSFRLFSFPLFFSCWITIDLIDFPQSHKSSLSFVTDFGNFDKNKINEIYQECATSENALCDFIIKSTKYLIDLEKKSGCVSSRKHIQLLPPEFHL